MCCGQVCASWVHFDTECKFYSIVLMEMEQCNIWLNYGWNEVLGWGFYHSVALIKAAKSFVVNHTSLNLVEKL